MRAEEVWREGREESVPEVVSLSWGGGGGGIVGGWERWRLGMGKGGAWLLCGCFGGLWWEINSHILRGAAKCFHIYVAATPISATK